MLLLKLKFLVTSTSHPSKISPFEHAVTRLMARYSYFRSCQHKVKKNDHPTSWHGNLPCDYWGGVPKRFSFRIWKSSKYFLKFGVWSVGLGDVSNIIPCVAQPTRSPFFPSLIAANPRINLHSVVLDGRIGALSFSEISRPLCFIASGWWGPELGEASFRWPFPEIPSNGWVITYDF